MRFIESCVSWVLELVSGLIRFITSGTFRDVIREILAWIVAFVLWTITSVRDLAIAFYRYVKSKGFREVVRRATESIIHVCKKLLVITGKITRRLYEIATSSYVREKLATATRLINHYLPEASQKTLALAAVLFVTIVLILSVPEDEPVVTEPGITRIQTGLPDFREIPAGRERKAAFFGYFLPIVEDENRKILNTRLKLTEWFEDRDDLSSRSARAINEIATRYRLSDFEIDSDSSWDELFSRVDVVPPSLALAQSANESAWGTSRFAREGLNFFGQWCFTRGCGLVPQRRDANKTHEVASFDSPRESVERYILNLNSNSAYDSLREIRTELRESNDPVTGHELAAGLNRYSERGQAYVDELREMIEFNKLTRYDKL